MASSQPKHNKVSGRPCQYFREVYSKYLLRAVVHTNMLNNIYLMTMHKALFPLYQRHDKECKPTALHHAFLASNFFNFLLPLNTMPLSFVLLSLADRTNKCIL